MLAACAAKPAVQLVARAAPAATGVPGEQTQPLAIRAAAAFAARRAPSPVFSKTLAHEFDAAPDAANNGTAYYAAAGTLTALDLANGRVRWRKALDALPDGLVATSDGITVVERYPGPLRYFDAQTGAQIAALKDTRAAGSIDGVLFAKNNDTSSYFALDAKTGEKLWGTYGGGMQVAGAPEIRNGMLLQLFVNDGAILENVLYAFDPANGHAKWNVFSNTAPLGYRGERVYVDSTWFPDQLDNYVPLSVESVDLRTGKKLDEFTYRPDPQRNAATYHAAPVKAYVTGGYVYVKVSGTWYRYDADRAPPSAHPSSVPGLDIAHAFENGALLVTGAHGASIAHASAGGMTLSGLPDGALRSPVAAGTSGFVYAVIGERLYSFDPQGRPRAVGAVRCAHINSVLPWPGNLAVMCAHRELRFADTSRAAQPVAVSRQREPRKALAMHAFTIPPASGFAHQWWVGPMAPGRDGGIVMVLDRGAVNFAGAIGFVSADGTIRTVADGRDLAPPPPGSRFAPTQPRSQWPPKPNTVVVDRNGNVWFNNALWPAILRLDPSGAIGTTLVGEVSKNAWRRGAIRLALGPDGAAWFARSHPTKEIARADGTRTFAIPPRYGDALVLIPARDGFWFVSQRQLVHVTLGGAFHGTPLPAPLRNPRAYPPFVTASAPDGVWIASGRYIARMNERGVLAHYDLPDATLAVQAMTSACDGSLYVAENAPEVLRLAPGAKAFERYDIPYRQLDGLMRAPNCAIWFVEGSNMPAQHVGTLGG